MKFHITPGLRYQTREYQEAAGTYGGGTVTKHRQVLQQWWECSECLPGAHGEWRDVPTVSEELSNAK